MVSCRRKLGHFVKLRVSGLAFCKCSAISNVYKNSNGLSFNHDLSVDRQVEMEINFVNHETSSLTKLLERTAGNAITKKHLRFGTI
jgi:hypothetical protein